jgi:arsenate reductase
MAKVTIYHNPKCSTSMAALGALNDAGVDHEVVLYLKDHPDRQTLEAIIAKLEDDPADLVRRDSYFKNTIVGEQGFEEATLSDPEVVIDLLLAHPRLLQRPVLVKGETAIIGRPKSRVPALISS